MEVVLVSAICTAVGTAITVCAIVWANGRSAGKVQEWMKGHEKLDAARFEAVANSIEAIQTDVRQLLTR